MTKSLGNLVDETLDKIFPADICRKCGNPRQDHNIVNVNGPVISPAFAGKPEVKEVRDKEGKVVTPGQPAQVAYPERWGFSFSFNVVTEVATNKKTGQSILFGACSDGDGSFIE